VPDCTVEARCAYPELPDLVWRERVYPVLDPYVIGADRSLYPLEVVDEVVDVVEDVE